MIYIAFTCSLDLYNISNFTVNQTFSIMNKSFFKVKKTCGSAWLLWLSHNNLFAFKPFLVIGDVHLALFTFRSILVNFVGNKNNCILLKNLPRKPGFLKKSDQLTWWVLTVFMSHNNSFMSKTLLVISYVYPALFAMRSF